MRITIIAPGSRGDVEPYLALGNGLLTAGHAVRFVTHEDFSDLVSAQGLELFPIKGSVQDIVQGNVMRNLVSGGNFLAILAEMAKEAERSGLMLADGAIAACRDADLLVAGVGGLFIGLAMAEKFHLPLVQAFYIPFTPTSAYPSFLIPKMPIRSGVINRVSFIAARQVMWQSFRAADRRARREVLNLPPAPLMGPFGSPALRGMPVLYGYSPTVIQPPPDWDANTHVTGYWFMEPDPAWVPPVELTTFLEAGDPPVYIGYGSMSSRDPAATTAVILEALARVGRRAVMLAGWGGLSTANLPENVLVINGAPFAWLFPRIAVVVHHGGAGTTAAGLRAGVPAVITPFFADQPYWAGQVARLGVGPSPLPFKKLTASALADRLHIALTDTEMRRRASELGAAIRAEDGVARAVAVISQIDLSRVE